MYQSAAAIWLQLESAVAELRRHQLAVMMFRGFDIAMYHICSSPLLDFVEYGQLVATSRFAADKVSHCTAVAQLRGFWAFDLALFHIIYERYLGSDDYHNLCFSCDKRRCNWMVHGASSTAAKALQADVFESIERSRRLQAEAFDLANRS